MGFHWEYLLPLAILALLFFGPKRLPEVGSSIGKTIREFQKSMREVTDPAETPSLPTGQAASVAPTLPTPQPAQPAQLAQPAQPPSQPSRPTPPPSKGLRHSRETPGPRIRD